MVNLLRVHQDEMNENEGGNAQTTSAQSLVHSPHADLSKYGHVTTQSVSLCSEENQDQLFPCKLFNINSSSAQGLTRPQLYSEQEVLDFLTTFPNAVNNVQLTDLKFDSQDILKCVKQQDQVFGFIPLTSLSQEYKLGDLSNSAVLSQDESDPLACYKKVRDSQKYNCQRCRIQLPDSIDFDYLFSFGRDYWDYQLFAFLKFGFPLDFDRRNTFLCPTFVSHNSAWFFLSVF